MSTHLQHRIAGLGMAVVVLLAGWGASPKHDVTTTTAAPMERAASTWWPSWWLPRPTTTTRPRPTTTTRPPATTTTQAPATTQAPTTTRPPTTTTTRPPVTTTTQAPTTTQPPTPTTLAPLLPGGLSGTQLNELLALVNAKRLTGTTCGGTAYPAVPALSLQNQISAAADSHARDMAANNYFSHTGRDGSDVGTRLTRVGYSWRAWAENIAAGQPTPSSVISALFSSAGHCQNFMSAEVTQIGFGKAENPASTYRVYWVADLASPR